MNKKEFYVAPEWGMRVVMVQRHYLLDNSNDPVQDAPGGDEDYNNYPTDF